MKNNFRFDFHTFSFSTITNATTPPGPLFSFLTLPLLFSFSSFPPPPLPHSPSFWRLHCYINVRADTFSYSLLLPLVSNKQYLQYWLTVGGKKKDQINPKFIFLYFTSRYIYPVIFLPFSVCTLKKNPHI